MYHIESMRRLQRTSLNIFFKKKSDFDPCVKITTLNFFFFIVNFLFQPKYTWNEIFFGNILSFIETGLKAANHMV